MLMFTILSIIVSIFTSTFMNIITSGEWFFIYSIFFCCIPIAVCVEVNDKLDGTTPEEYLDDMVYSWRERAWKLMMN